MARLQSDQLRTFLAIAEAGSVTGGAQRIGRSQSAASLQIRQLEGVVGRPLFRRHGRGVSPTPAGERLLPVARRVTRALESTLAELRGEALSGRLRIGMPDDQGRAVLAPIVADFAARHPDVALQVHCALGAGFDAALRSGALDLAVFEVPRPDVGDEVLRESRLVWMARGDAEVTARAVLPVAVFEQDCWWRDRALADLEQAGRDYRIVFTGESAIGVRAAVASGIAAGLLDGGGAAGDLETVAGLGGGHPSCLVMRLAAGADSPPAAALRAAFRRAYATGPGRPVA